MYNKTSRGWELSYTERYFKTDYVWFADFSRSFNEAMQGGATPAQELSQEAGGAIMMSITSYTELSP